MQVNALSSNVIPTLLPHLLPLLGILLGILLFFNCVFMV